ncbi:MULTISPECIES: EamA family transporter RarD [unclassified Roseitalea]|uniref:EamA family transporter RarD n=1 Tax=unclassified Roseitalea TaxID=2639107 RepID=UPI00273F8779|nr:MULTISPECIES: EamA family transporter RarD [unclassified Roseitalea]
MGTRSASAAAPAREPASGFAFAIAGFLLWGVLPIYVKLVDHVPPVELVAHRIIWSVPVAGLVLVALGRTRDLRAALASPRTLAMAALTAGLVSFNWGIYMWAIMADRLLEGALGYYINPLVNVLLGAALLGERFTRLQGLAIGCAVIAVAILTFRAGGLPWVSLALAFSFGFYGFFRKTLPIGAAQGFMLEVLILSPAALAAIAWYTASGNGHFGPTGWSDIGLLLLAGPFTAIPLLLFTFGARSLRYATMGILQYLTPTLLFLLAVFAFGEPFSLWQLVAFAFIWTGLALYTLSLLRAQPRRPAPPSAATD